MTKMTKTQRKRLAESIHSKTTILWGLRITTQDLIAIDKIGVRALKRIG